MHAVRARGAGSWACAPRALRRPGGCWLLAPAARAVALFPLLPPPFPPLPPLLPPASPRQSAGHPRPAARSRTPRAPARRSPPAQRGDGWRGGGRRSARRLTVRAPARARGALGSGAPAGPRAASVRAPPRAPSPPAARAGFAPWPRPPPRVPPAPRARTRTPPSSCCSPRATGGPLRGAARAEVAAAANARQPPGPPTDETIKTHAEARAPPPGTARARAGRPCTCRVCTPHVRPMRRTENC